MFGRRDAADSDYPYDDEDDGDDDFEFECGAYINGKFDYYSCTLAGTDDCDWDCPNGAFERMRAMKAKP